MPNGVDLGPTVFTQWRTQQGGGFYRLGTYRPNTSIVGDLIRAFYSYKLMGLNFQRGVDWYHPQLRKLRTV